MYPVCSCEHRYDHHRDDGDPRGGGCAREESYSSSAKADTRTVLRSGVAESLRSVTVPVARGLHREPRLLPSIKDVAGVSKMTTATSVTIRTSFFLGVWWFVWGKFGFWWGVLYGLFWQVWIGYRLAAWLLGE